MTKTIADVWDDPCRPWPSIAYVETTNRCNANCLSCLNDRLQRRRADMSLETFKQVAWKLKEHGVLIGAMFCFGEPLLDKTITQKFLYARTLGVLTPHHVGLNTNCSMLTEDRFDDLLFSTPNVTLSFFNVGTAFERLTGLNWPKCYDNALRFIRYRDEINPTYPIFIGVNKVAGHDLEAVKAVFDGLDVEFVQDAELRYDGGKSIDGVLDRTRMYPDWRCDGYKGAIQIKPDLGVEFCAYDIIGTPDGGETRISQNFLDEPWDRLELKFRRAWAAGSTLCRRCDYWYGAKELIECATNCT